MKTTSRKTLHRPVIFVDLGGTYMTNALVLIRAYAKRFGVPEKKFDDAIMGSNWTQYATGKIDDRRYWQNIVRLTGISRTQATAFRTALYSFSRPQKGMTTLIRALKQRHRIAVLSSHVAGWVAVQEKKHSIAREFHEQHFSFDHGVDKPNTRLFLLAARTMHVPAKDCIVIDDNRVFLQHVRNTGAKTILFKSASDTQRRLRTLGVSL